MHFGKYRVAQKCKFIIKVKSRWDIIYCHQIWRDYYPFLPVAPTFIATRIEPLLFLGNLIWGHNLGSKTFLSRISLFFTGIHRHWNEKIRHSGLRSWGATSQAYPSCFSFRISWTLMEGNWYFIIISSFGALIFQGLCAFAFEVLQKPEGMNEKKSFYQYLWNEDNLDKVGWLTSQDLYYIL